MSDLITVAVAFRIDDEIVRQIEAVDPRIRVIALPALSGREPGPPDAATKAQLKASLAEADILFGPGGIPTEYFEATTNLKWFQVINAGVDRLASDGVLQRGFTVTNVSGMTAIAIAEYILGTMVMLAKDIHRAVRAQVEHRWEFRFTGELAGKTLGIAGMGAIGRETARRAKAFGMRVVASRRTVAAGATDPDCDVLLSYTELDRLLQESDYVALCVPLTPETRGFIGARELKLMKPTAFLINIARGSVVDQEALIAALKDGTIAGAALDVTDPEPLPPDSPLWDMTNVILTPHISGAIQGYGHRAAEIFLANLRRYVAGEPLEHRVHPELGY